MTEITTKSNEYLSSIYATQILLCGFFEEFPISRDIPIVPAKAWKVSWNHFIRTIRTIVTARNIFNMLDVWLQTYTMGPQN